MYFVRSAMKGDLPAVQELLAETWHDTYDALYGRDAVTDITKRWHSMEVLKASLDRPHSEFVVADDGTRIGGTAYAQRISDEAVILRQLYVRASLQRQGIGSDLLSEIETCFDGARLLRLEVEERNGKALAFYHGRGFANADRKLGSDPAGVELPVLVLVLEKPLPVI